MITVSEYRVEPYRSVEIALGATYVTKIILGNTPVEEDPTICRVQAGENVELAYSVSVTTFRQSLPSPEHEDILVVLGPADRDQ